MWNLLLASHSAFCSGGVASAQGDRASARHGGRQCRHGTLRKSALYFKQYMANGDIESLHELYDPEIVFVNNQAKSETAGMAWSRNCDHMLTNMPRLSFAIWRLSSPEISRLCLPNGKCRRLNQERCMPLRSPSAAGRDLALADWRPLHCQQACRGTAQDRLKNQFHAPRFGHKNCVSFVITITKRKEEL